MREEDPAKGRAGVPTQPPPWRPACCASFRGVTEGFPGGGDTTDVGVKLGTGSREHLGQRFPGWDVY